MKQCCHDLGKIEYRKNICILANEVLSDTCDAQKNRPMFLESLFSIVLLWSYYETFSSNITSRHFIHSCLFIILSPVFKSGISKGMLSLI